MNETGPTIWNSFIKINKNTGMFEVNHNNNPGISNNTEFSFFLIGITTGKKSNAK